MSFRNKLEAVQKELNTSNILIPNHNLSISALLRKLGFNIRPLHCCSFASNFLTTTFWFSILWGGIMWLISWRIDDTSIIMALLTSMLSGLLFALFMALYYKRSAKKQLK